MNFKDSYKKDNEKIVPDAAFLEKLANEMENAKAEQKRNKMKKIRYISSAAACLLVVVGGILIYSNSNNNVPMTDDSQGGSSFTIKAGKNDNNSKGNNIFKDNTWYDEDMSEVQIYSEFISKISNNDDLNKLYQSDAETFEDNDLVDEKEISELISRIKNADMFENKAELEKPVNYMAVLNSGDVIKFSIYDDSYVKINGVEAVFKI